MNKKFFSFLIMGMAVCAVVSCSKDEDGDSGAPGAESGTLASDDAEINAEVADLRIASVGDYRYAYDDKGKLETISSRYGDWTLYAKDNFKVEYKSEYNDSYDEETYTFSISNNHITSMSTKWSWMESWSDGEERDSGSGSGSMTYNSKGQLSSVKYSFKATEVYKYDGETEKYTYSGEHSVAFTYSSDNRITKIEVVEKETGDGESYTTKETYEYEYSPGVPNMFYQYTPQIVDDIDFGSHEMDAFSYVGLFGKASSYIPTRCVVKWTESSKYGGHEEKEEGGHTNTYSCYLNANGSISYADGENYTYNNIDTRAVLAGEQSASSDIKPRRGFMHHSIKHRRQLNKK